MVIKLTTLSEDTAGRGNLLGERGLSIFVEAPGLSILFDAGQSVSAVHNADILGVDLGRTSLIVLSHGHYDHTGGLRLVLRRLGKETGVIAHPDIWRAKYRQDGEEYRFIGVPFHRQTLESAGARFNLRRESLTIADNIMTSGEIPMTTGYEKIEPGLVVRVGGRYRRDELRDDQALIINTPVGLVVILGCAHRGIINTLHHARKLTGVEKIYAVLGGCHLEGASEERVYLTIAALKELGVERAGVSHCTGLPASAIMAQELGGRFFFNNAGTEISL